MPSPFLYFLIILVTTLPSTYYIYNYPSIHNCSWPDPSAPFRLLAFGDPQIEGDKKQKSWRGRTDIWGNDRYLKHVHNSVLGQVLPEATHEVVLGDLFGSQWIPDEEFLQRVHRYKDIIFKDHLRGEMYGVERFINITGNHDIGYAGELNEERLSRWEDHFGKSNHIQTLLIPPYPPLRIVLFNTLNLDSPATSKELQNKTHTFLQSLLPDDAIAIPQTVLLTHLPLYRGEGICSDPPKFEYWKLNITDSEGNVTGYFRPIKHQNHLSRWASDWILETVFGEHDEGVILGGHDHEGCDVLHRRREDDWDYHWPDEPFSHDELKRRKRSLERTEIAASEDIMHDSANEISSEDTTVGDPVTAKENLAGVEIAGEENFDNDEDYGEAKHPLEISQYAAHQRNNISDGIWMAQKFSRGVSGIREITVRSMMGDFQGNVGLLTGNYNQDTQLWEFEYSTCIFVVQHWWWLVHIWDMICLVWITGYMTRPLWRRHWELKGRPALERGLERISWEVEGFLEGWGVVQRGRRRQDTEQGGRKRLD